MWPTTISTPTHDLAIETVMDRCQRDPSSFMAYKTLTSLQSGVGNQFDALNSDHKTPPKSAKSHTPDSRGPAILITASHNLLLALQDSPVVMRCARRVPEGR